MFIRINIDRNASKKCPVIFKLGGKFATTELSSGAAEKLTYNTTGIKVYLFIRYFKCYNLKMSNSNTWT